MSYDPVDGYNAEMAKREERAEAYRHRQCGECEDFEESMYRAERGETCCVCSQQFDCEIHNCCDELLSPFVGKCKRDGEFRLSCDRGCE